jgi:hypothetical protein
MYELKDSKGMVFVTVTGTPVNNETVFIKLTKHHEPSEGFDLSIIFDYLKDDGYKWVLTAVLGDITLSAGWVVVCNWMESTVYGHAL